jgi:4-hydroxy-4-methyl-2-oxoglutarate aldolase
VNVDQSLGNDLAEGEPVGVASIVDAMSEIGLAGYIDGVPELLISQSFRGAAMTLEIDDSPSQGPDGRTEGSDRLLLEFFDGLKAGQVLVISTSNSEIGCLGGVSAAVSVAHGVAGVVTNGLIRDVDEIRSYGLNVRYRAADARARRGTLTRPGGKVDLGNVAVTPGDLIVADGDGVVVVPVDRITAIMSRALEIETRERKIANYALTHGSLAAAHDIVDN